MVNISFTSQKTEKEITFIISFPDTQGLCFISYWGGGGYGGDIEKKMFRKH